MEEMTCWGPTSPTQSSVSYALLLAAGIVQGRDGWVVRLWDTSLSSGHLPCANTDNGSCSERSPVHQLPQNQMEQAQLRSEIQIFWHTENRAAKVLSHARSGGASQACSLCLPAPTQIPVNWEPLWVQGPRVNTGGSPRKDFHCKATGRP